MNQVEGRNWQLLQINRNSEDLRNLPNYRLRKLGESCTAMTRGDEVECFRDRSSRKRDFDGQRALLPLAQLPLPVANDVMRECIFVKRGRCNRSFP